MSAEKKFRITAKKYFLTYPQCGETTKEELLAFLKTKAQVIRYIVARELHEDGNPHLHAVVEYVRKLNIKDPRAFDYKDLHPNIQSCRNYQDSYVYCTKGSDFITDTTFDYSDPTNYRKRKADWLEFKKDQEDRSRKDIEWPVTTFDDQTWEPIEKKRGLWIVGAANTGKTTWWMQHFDQPNFKYFLRRQMPYPYEGYNGEQLIICDDNEPTLEEILKIINLHGRNQVVPFQTRYSPTFLPYKNGEWYMCMIVCSNRTPVFSEDDTFKARFDIMMI